MLSKYRGPTVSEKMSKLGFANGLSTANFG